MIMPGALLLIASYVGPVASPDTSGEAPRTKKHMQRLERNSSVYINPQNQPNYRNAEQPSVLDKAAEGRMVVPEKFL